MEKLTVSFRDSNVYTREAEILDHPETGTHTHTHTHSGLYLCVKWMNVWHSKVIAGGSGVMHTHTHTCTHTNTGAPLIGRTIQS